MNFSPTVTSPILSAEFTEGEKDLNITYLTERPPTTDTSVLPIRYNFNDYDSIINLYSKIIDFCAEYRDSAGDWFAFPEAFNRRDSAPRDLDQYAIGCVDLLKELIIKEQHNCKATGYWKTNSVKYNFLLIAHEYLSVFRK